MSVSRAAFCGSPTCVELYTLITMLGIGYITLDTVTSAIGVITHGVFPKLAVPLSSYSYFCWQTFQSV